MAGSKKVIELPVFTALQANDRIIVEQVAANSSITGTTSIETMRRFLVKGGPFANDATANTGGVQVGQLYYTADGTVKIRLT